MVAIRVTVRDGSAMNLVSLLAVGFGAFAGAVLRWMLGIALSPLLPTLPLGTLAANLIGGFVMGIAMGAFAHFEALPIAARLALTTGFLGGLTTFSTFSAETVTLFLRQQYAWTAAIIATHLVGSLLMTLAGIGLVRLLLRA
jgi:CrcB protein